MSSMLFNIAIDWVLCRTMEDQRRGIRWTPFTILEDLDFADDLALLSHTRQHIQEKTDRLSMFSNQVGLRISLKNTEAMCVNVPSPKKIRVRGQDIPYTNKFTYLGSDIVVGNRLSRKTMEICTKEVKSRQAAPPAVAVKPNAGAADPLAFCAGKVICGG